MQDIHTHLYWQSYDMDRDEVVKRAREAGVQEMFVIGCTLDESRQAVELTKKYEHLYAAVGIHPQEYVHTLSDEELASQMAELHTLAKDSQVVAIGECGLEYYAHDQEKPVTDEQKAMQKRGFLAQIKLAEALKLPIIVHGRASTGTQDAYEDLYEMLRSYAATSIVLHCYMGDTEITKKFLTLSNVYFSFTGNITYPVKKTNVGTKDDLTETVKLIPLERLFTETDCPFLTPQSKRGERNEPAYVEEVIVQVATLQNKTFEVVEQAVQQNVHKFLLCNPMPEKPPMPGASPEKKLEEMTLPELEEKIGELTVDLDNAARSNSGTRELESIIAQIINERARYEMRRQELLHSQKKSEDGV